MNYETIQRHIQESFDAVSAWAQSPAFYAQCGLIVSAVLLAIVLAKVITRTIRVPAAVQAEKRVSGWRRLSNALRVILLPLFVVVLLGFAKSLSAGLFEQSWLVKVSQGLAVVWLAYAAASQFVEQSLVKQFFKWIVIPVAILHVFGWLSDVTAYLEAIKLEVGNIRLSLYAIVRVLIFGSVLFWLGRKSNDTGKQFIRGQEQLEVGTREVFAKLFEILVFLVIFFLILQVMGINITTLAVFGGALGVGIGFGLQAIASNFISGLIILLDRSLTVGDYIELEDGRGGTIRALNMRSTILETYDGKDIVVPNETFITTPFVNWTKKNIRQRYSFEVQIAYDSDVEHVIALIKELVASHPQVISGPDASFEEQPDSEISGFGDSGIDILVEYWMEGIDDGKNRVGADLYLMIWKAFKEHHVEIPYPRREVTLLNRAD